MFSSLRSFLSALDAAGELHCVGVEVSPSLEISEIADRQSKSHAPTVSAAAMRFDPQHCGLGGKAILFEHVTGSDFPVAINVFGSYRRMEMALGCQASGAGFESIAARIGAVLRPQPPRTIRQMAAKARQMLPLLRIPPRTVRRGPCQDVVKLASRGEVDLTRLPLLKCWPLDGDLPSVGCADLSEPFQREGRYITFAGMHTIHYQDRDDPRPASHNIGMYRAQLVDRTRLVMHWHIHHDGAAHWRSWKAAAPGRPMPIAIALGGESVLPYAATAPLPPGMSELLLAGYLNGRGIPMVRCKTVPLRVPANSEIVIEGWVSTECGEIGFDPRDGPNGDAGLGPGAALEGPFGDHTGFYSLPDRYPIVDVTAITHRSDAIYPAIIVGHPPQEDYYLGKATERIFLPLLKTIIHDIDDYHLPMFGCFHNCAFIRIRKAYALQARRVMHAVWGAGQMSWTKFIIVVDDDVDVHDEPAVLRAVFENCHFGRDLELVHGPLDILDHAAPHLGAGTKLGIDATRKVAGEQVHGVPIVTGHGQAVRAVDRSWASDDIMLPEFGCGRCALVRVNKRDAGDGGRAIEAVWKRAPHGSAEFVVAVDQRVDISDWQQALFHLCANTDPGRDLHVESPKDASACRVGFDATTKLPGDSRNRAPARAYPPIIEMDGATKSLVAQRWADYGLA